jgi:cytochrome b involved in lipid metabolism
MASSNNENDRKISPEELSKHATAKDCWLLIDGIVYDVTKYQDSHPGGCAVMVEHAGQDCTSNFDDIGARPTPSFFLPI